MMKNNLWNKKNVCTIFENMRNIEKKYETVSEKMLSLKKRNTILP